jgi:hypothetical protein
MSIEKRLSEIQKNLDVPKSRFNKFAGFHFRNAEDILNAVKELLKDSESIVIQDEIVYIEGRYYVRATASLYIGKDSISVSAYAREPDGKKGMDESQVTGATSSYARKYALNGLLAIDDVRDSDFDGTDETKVDADDADLLVRAMQYFPNDKFLVSVGEGLKKYGAFTDKQRKAVKDKVSQGEDMVLLDKDGLIDNS